MANFPYTIRKSKRAKQGKIVVTPKGVEVVIPWYVPKSTVPIMLRGKEKWVAERLASMEERKTDFKIFWPKNFTPQEYLSYQGEKISLNKVPKKYWNNAHLVSWLKEQARENSAVIIAKYEPFLSKKHNRLAIKSQKNLWGSCSSKQNININWLLIFAPPKVLEYVVWHELCHLEHMNHSKKFWGLVASQMPNYKAQKLWLKNYGSILKDFSYNLS